MTIHEAYRKAGEYHGHYCPGLAIGVRAAMEARILLGSDLCCIVERSACWLDGMVLVGATLGNGKLKLRETGKPAFSFYNNASGNSLRLVLKPGPSGMNKNELTEWLLTAPIEDVFTSGKTRFPFPEYRPGPGEVICSVCGEPVQESLVQIQNGKPVCTDCL